MPVQFDFSGKVVLVTGVARLGQIGHAIAEAFGQAGARLVAADRNAVAVAERVKEFKAAGIEASPAAGDLTEPDIAALAVETALKRYQGLDVLVNVAGGLTTWGDLGHVAMEDFDREVAMNLKTTYLMSRAGLDALARSRGCIVNFASSVVIDPQKSMAVYSAAKWGVAGFTRSLARDLWSRGIRVNAVAPSTVRTRENVEAAGDDSGYVEIRDVVAAVLFLASDAASAITGHILPVSNGV